VIVKRRLKNLGYNDDMKDYRNECEKVHCRKCGFYFFTRYVERINRKLCSTCDTQSINVRTVRNWEL